MTVIGLHKCILTIVMKVDIMTKINMDRVKDQGETACKFADAAPKGLLYINSQAKGPDLDETLERPRIIEAPKKQFPFWERIFQVL